MPEVTSDTKRGKIIINNKVGRASAVRTKIEYLNTVCFVVKELI